MEQDLKKKRIRYLIMGNGFFIPIQYLINDLSFSKIAVSIIIAIFLILILSFKLDNDKITTVLYREYIIHICFIAEMIDLGFLFSSDIIYDFLTYVICIVIGYFILKD